MKGMMPGYHQHVLIRTGRSDWSSRIEDDGNEEKGGNLARKLKDLVGRGGSAFDVGMKISNALLVSQAGW